MNSPTRRIGHVEICDDTLLLAPPRHPSLCTFSNGARPWPRPLTHGNEGHSIGRLQVVAGCKREVDAARQCCRFLRITRDQLRQIIEAPPGPYRNLFALLTGTGMRIGEATGLHLDDLDLENGVIHVGIPKAG